MRFGIVSPELISLVFVVVVANISLAFLNMLPIPPLDGSKVVAAFLSPSLYMRYREFENLTYMLGPFGLLLVLILIINFLSPVLGTAVSWFFAVLTGIAL